jgi:uncharacterized membrane protein YdfJ with MMPL/SSD domain
MTTLEAPPIEQGNTPAASSRATKPPGLTERLAVASARRPKRTLAIWGLVIVVALVLITTSLKGLTSNAYVVGGTQSKTAEALYSQVIGAQAAGRTPTDVIVVSSASSTVADPSFRSYVGRLIAEVRTDPGISSVGTDLSAGSKLVSSDHRAALIELRAATDADIKPVVKAVQAASGIGGFSAAITGDHTVGNDFTTQSSKDLAHGEIGFGLPVALIVLVLVFGAVVAGLMPVMLGMLSILVGLGVAALFAREFTLSIFIVNMMTAMGLALGIDYSLFVISRFREERARGLDKEAAIRRMGQTASRAVLFSGSTFVVALLGLFIVRTNVLRSLAAGAVIVGAVSVVAALTLLPAVLSLMGDRVNSFRLPIVGRNLGAASASGSRIWRAFIERVLRRPVIALVLAGGVMLLAAAPVLGLHIGQSGVSTLPNGLPSKQGYVAVQRLFPNQNPYPVEIVAEGGSATDRADLTKLQTTLASETTFGSGAIQASSNGKLVALTVPITGAPVSNVDVAAVRNLRTNLIPAAFAGSGTSVYVGGTTAETADYFAAVSSPTLFVLLFVLGLSFVVLMLAFRSLVIAAVSILLNLLSVGAAYGLLTLVFLHGIGAGIFGFHQQAAIDAWVPLFLFAVLFALSMDYQVFLMSRIKERFDETGSTREAAISGVASTAKIITGAALIIIAVFSGFARGQLVMFQQMGFGVAVALLLDATLIRTVILPSALTVLGEHSWYLPRWLGWLPHIEVESPESLHTDAASVSAPIVAS